MKDDKRAFPIFSNDSITDGGMSLRDYFAGQALGMSIKRAIRANNPDICADAAKRAYLYADAMIEEREKE